MGKQIVQAAIETVVSAFIMAAVFGVGFYLGRQVTLLQLEESVVKLGKNSQAEAEVQNEVQHGDENREVSFKEESLNHATVAQQAHIIG